MSTNAYQFTFSQHENFIMCFIFFLVIFSNFLIISVAREKIKAKLAVAIPTGDPATLVNEIIDTPLAVALRTIKTLSL